MICPFIAEPCRGDCTFFLIGHPNGYKFPYSGTDYKGCAFFLGFQNIYKLQEDFSKFQNDFSSFIKQYKTTIKGETKK